MTRQRIRAFTLVELLVVILIISILMALLLPTIENAREAAYSVSCADRQRQLILLTHEYNQDYRTLLGQKLTITQGPQYLFGYQFLYEGGYLSKSDIIDDSPWAHNMLANRWRKGNSSLMMCPAARYHGYGALWPQGLDELVYVGDRNRWRDIWSNSSPWKWNVETEFKKSILLVGGISAISSYSMPRETRNAEKIGSQIYYTAMKRVENPSRKIWWIEASEPRLACYNSWINQAAGIRNSSYTGTMIPHIRLPHPYAKGGNYTAYDGHVGQYSDEDFIETAILSHWDVYGSATQTLWPRFEFSAPEEGIVGQFYD